MDGREIRVKLVDVTYAPGGANASHSHPCPVVGYVLQGALRMRVNDAPEVIYRTGDTFYEGPGDIHRTSANASTTERFGYLYADGELREWVPRIHALARQSRGVRVLMNNCYRQYAVQNAKELASLLTEAESPR